MNRMIHILLAASACLALSAQSVAEHPAYFRLGAVSPQGDLRAYLGGRPLAHAFEMGYDFQGPDAVAGIGVYATYLVATGRENPNWGGLKQSLYGWRFGADIRFRTPIRNLTPYLGANLVSYDGANTADGQIPNFDAPGQPFVLRATTYSEGKGKFGGRFGLEYRITKEWGLSLDYSFSEWRSDYRLGDYTPASGHRVIKGINPVNPSWITLSAQYRWSIW